VASEKELKQNSARSLGDDIGRKRLELGQKRNIQEKRQRDEAALKELQENLIQLQGELKVSCNGVQELRQLISGSRSMLLHNLPRRHGGRRTMLWGGIGRRGRMRRMMLLSRLGFISRA
jgi:hypothetical protein